MTGITRKHWSSTSARLPPNSSTISQTDPPLFSRLISLLRAHKN
jgi:hypothetical protein